MPLFPWLRKPSPSLDVKYSLAGPVIAYGHLGQPQWTPRQYQPLAQEGYCQNVIAHRCIKDIAQGVAAITVLLFQDEQELTTHPALDLLSKPTPTTTQAGLLETVTSQLLIAGNAYVEAVPGSQGQPIELWPLRPDRMQVISGKHGLPKGYEYKLGGQKKTWACDPMSGQSAILHLKSYHPLNDWYGMSPLEVAQQAIDQFNSAMQWNQSLLQNGCRPSGALSVEGGKDGAQVLSDDQYQRLRSQLEEAYSGAAKAGRPMLLEGGLRWTDMMLSPKDMDYLNVKHTAARDIAVAFGYPPMLLGIPGDNTYSNQKEARLALWEQTILPLAQHILSSLGHWLLPHFDEGLTFKIDEDALSALSPRREHLWARLQEADFLTDAEKRTALGYSADPE